MSIGQAESSSQCGQTLAGSSRHRPSASWPSLPFHWESPPCANANLVEADGSRLLARGGGRVRPGWRQRRFWNERFDDRQLWTDRGDVERVQGRGVCGDGRRLERQRFRQQDEEEAAQERLVGRRQRMLEPPEPAAPPRATRAARIASARSWVSLRSHASGGCARVVKQASIRSGSGTSRSPHRTEVEGSVARLCLRDRPGARRRG